MAFDEAIEACLRDTTPAALIALGHIDDPRAVVLLLQCVRFRDWRVRLLAVRALSAHTDPAAVAAIERSSKEDCSLPVRVEAALAVFRRDRERGTTLLTSMLAHPHATPSLSALINGALRGET